MTNHVVVPPPPGPPVVVVPPTGGSSVAVVGGATHTHSEYVQSLGLRRIEKITKAQHEALNPPDPNTVYLIVPPTP